MVVPGVGSMNQSEVISFIKDNPAGVLTLVIVETQFDKIYLL